MERLLLLRLASVGCAAEARLNDFSLGRTPAAGGVLTLAVHEYVLEGDNALELVIDPVLPGAEAPPRLAAVVAAARLHLLLPRIGAVGSPAAARTLATADWAAAEGSTIMPPVRVRRQAAIPVRFPRWRWLDVPPIDDAAAARPLVAAFVQSLALALARGDADAFVSAARLRFEELALAYQKSPADLAARWRSRIQLLHAGKALRPVLMPPGELLLRPCAGGRLLDCLASDGQPALRTEPAPDGTRHAWPMRVAIVDGQCHILR